MDAADGRARKKLLFESVRGRVSTPMMFWRDHVQRHPQGLYLDVGANYGECFAFGSYPTGSCVAIEANSHLIPYLERTRDDHPCRDRIKIVHALIAAERDEQASLFFDPKWTGGGSAAPGRSGLRELVVSTETLESILEKNAPGHDSPIVMKMDIEGYEGQALKGFPSLFEWPRVVGILEFDTDLLSQAGTDARDLYELMARHFSVYLTFNHQRRLQTLDSWEALQRCSGRGGRLHRDLVFASSKDMISPGWLG